MEKTTTRENFSVKTGIKALLSIRDFENTKIKYSQQLNNIEADIEELTRTALAIIKGRSTSNAVEKGKILVHEIRESFDALHKTFNAVKIRIELRNRIIAFELWNKIHINLERLKDSFANLYDFGNSLLEESDVAIWKKNMNNFAILILPSIFSFIESSKLELKIIESYSVEDLNKILNNILRHFHKGFDFDEADSFQSDYLVPLKNLELDFVKEKKLWTKFSAILNVV